MIYEAADHRNDADINSTWQNLLDATHAKVVENPKATEKPFEAVINMVRDMAHRLNLSESTFSPAVLIPMIEKYALECQRDVGPQTWVVDLFIHVNFPFETILNILQTMFYNDVAPFSGRNRRILGDHMLYTIQQWYQECVRTNARLFGGEGNAQEISQLLVMLSQNGLGKEEVDKALDLRNNIDRAFR